MIVATGASVTATMSAAWTATATTNNAGTASINTAGFAVSLASATGVNGWAVTNTSGAGTSLTGSTKADTLTGGTGNDTMIGGSGADLFVLTQGGQDVINDFNLTGDVISLAGWGVADFAALGAFMSNAGGNTFINVDPLHQVTLIGVNPASLLANDFLFA